MKQSHAYLLLHFCTSYINSVQMLHMQMQSSNMEMQAMDRTRTHQPCAACRTLRRRCDNNCVLGPYFPSDEIEKFASVHKVFGASNVIKMIQMVEETKREDTVTALVYEATARLRDPVYGTTRTILHLQKMAEELKTQLDSTRARVLELQQQKDEILGVLSHTHDPPSYATSFELDYDALTNMLYIDG